jgi:hypothetical protein
MKKFLVLIFAVAFVLSVVGFSLAAMMAYHGTITAISGNKVTVKDATGKIENITVSGTPGAWTWKVGDKVVVNDGKIISEDIWERKSTPGASMAFPK